MGYMGFGLQKWIYNLRPRRPFSRDRKPTGDTLSRYQHDDLLIEGRIHHIPIKSKIDKEDLLKERKRNRVINIIIYSLVTFFIVMFIAVIVLSNKSKEIDREEIYLKIEANRSNRKENYEKRKNKAYNIMLEYGEYYTKKKDYDKAINEYNQAIYLDSTKIEAKIALANTLFLLCIDENINCIEAIDLYNDLYELDKSEIYLRKCAEIYIHLKEYDKADLLLNIIEKN